MNRNKPDLGIVVVVDDDSLVTRPVERELRRLFKKENLPYNVITSQEPRKVLLELENFKADLAVVISDIKMVPMGGLEFLRIVKDKYPDTILMVLTGFADEFDVNSLKEEFELFSYLKKPWNDDQLKRTIKNALDSYRRKRLLNRYVPKEVVEEVLKRPNNEILAGVELEATIMFFDFRNSTHLFHSDAMNVQEALEHLNLYFRELLAVLDKYENGILDKFMGDGLMALFGVPHPATPTADAQNAVLAALEMKERVRNLNQQVYQFPLTIGIGISTGPVIAGNVGTEERANYTVLGNDVNIASRLEKAAKSIQDGILISESTYKYVKDIVEVREIDPLPPKGNRASIRTFEIKGL